MKIENIINETTAGATASGSVAAVPKPMGETQKRTKTGPKVAGLEPAGKVMFGKTKKTGPYQNSINEGKMKELQFDLRSDKDGLSDIEFKKKYNMTKEEMRKALNNKDDKKTNKSELSEDDIILVPGQSMKRKTGFVPRGQSRVDHEVEMARSDVLATMKNAKAIYELLKNRSEEEGIEGWVQEKLIKANDYLNSVKEYYDEKMMQEMQGGVVAAGGVGEGMSSGSIGYDNARAIAHAATDGTSADIQLGGDTVTLEYPEARFVYGIYKRAVKDRRIEDMIKTLEDPIKFHKLMKIMGDILYRDRSKEMAAAAAQRIGEPGMMEYNI